MDFPSFSPSDSCYSSYQKKGCRLDIEDTPTLSDEDRHDLRWIPSYQTPDSFFSEY